MFPPWDSLVDLQSYQDRLNWFLVWAGGITGILAAGAAIWLGILQIKISNRIDELRRRHETRGAIQTEQLDAAFPALKSLADRTDGSFDVLAVGPTVPRESFQLAAMLGITCSDRKLANSSWGEIDEAFHDGVILYAKNDTENAREFLQAIAPFDLNVRMQVGEFPSEIAKLAAEQRNYAADPSKVWERVVLSVGKLE